MAHLPECLDHPPLGSVRLFQVAPRVFHRPEQTRNAGDHRFVWNNHWPP
jgi:hypothetical protein